MPPVTVAPVQSQTDLALAEPEKQTTAKPIVGIIYPPPEIRNIVDKTASFVARNGPEFENRIRQNEANNPKFNFLSMKDPYHAYYQHKVNEFKEGRGIEPSAKTAVALVPTKIQEAVKAAEQFVPKEPPLEYEFLADPATISGVELETIKLTAQFVARNGRQFLTQLMNREARNFHFDFLKPQHSNFSYFTSLVEQYTKVLIPPKDIVFRLRKESSNPKELMEQVKYRVEWERYQQRIKEKEEAELEKERVAYASIDWHDFVVVQTVDFQPHEQINLPPPCTPKDVGTRILAQQRAEAAKSVQAVEMDVESESEGEEEHAAAAVSSSPPSQPRVIQPLPQPPKPEAVVIRKDYNPKGRQTEKTKAAEQQFVISPLTGEKIPADKLAEHMRLNTIDSQYFKQRELDQIGRQEEEPVYAPGSDIFSNIKGFAERRTDIFGRGAEETVVGRKIGEEQKKDNNPKAIWDGYTSSVESATKAAQSQITIEEQIAQIHRAKGLLADEDKERIGPQGTSLRPLVPPSAPPKPAELLPPVPPSVTIRSNIPVPPVPHQPRVAPAVVPMVQMSTQPVMVLPPQPHVQVGVPTLGMLSVPAFHTLPIAGMHMPRLLPPEPEDEDEGPASKKQKSEEQLVPEHQFLLTHKGNVEVKIAVPNIQDKGEWALNGQTLTFSLAYTDLVSTLKAKVQESINMPTSKQKLTYEGMFIKDSNSLAFYNMEPGSLISLQLKERGGRKK